MKFNDLYQKTVNCYPSEIDVSDGRFFEETNGFLSNNLSNAWNRARTSFENEWKELLIWNIYQMLHRKAKLLYEGNQPKLMIVDAAINLNELEKMYLGFTSRRLQRYVSEISKIIERLSLLQNEPSFLLLTYKKFKEFFRPFYR